MALPAIDDRGYSFTAFQQGQGDNTFPGTELDAELDAIHNWGEEVDVLLASIFRGDGTFKPNTVTREMLSTEVQLGLPTPTPWAATTSYTAGTSAVTHENALYVCAISHISSDFEDDFAAGVWNLVAEFEIPAAPPTNSVNTAAIIDGAVTEEKLATHSVTTDKIDDGALTPEKAAVSFGKVPVGGTMPFDGIRAPSGWLLCYGQAVSRTTYANLFAALSEVSTGNLVLNSYVITGIPTDLRNLGLEGAYVEMVGVPSNAQIASITANSITLTQPASTTTSEPRTLRIMPHGAGDGASTFNIPDKRGFVDAGRDNMGGTAANRLGNIVVGGRLNGSGGAERHQLSEAENAAHSHALNDGGHSHGYSDPGHSHASRRSTVGGGSDFGAIGAQFIATDNPTSASATGITINTATANVSVVVSGASAAHNNTQPTRISNKIIFTGVA